MKDNLLSKTLSFTTDYKHSRIILKALENIVMLLGDLHACFHMLGSVYKLFYGGLIQPIQTALSIKRIDYKKVEKNFGQCSVLVHRILHECERQAYDAYLFYMMGKNKSHLISLCVNPLLLAEYLAGNFEVWMDDRLEHTTDELFRFGLNFIKMARMYRLFR